MVAPAGKGGARGIAAPEGIKIWLGREKGSAPTNREGAVAVAEYYFDIETTGLDPLQDKIITIQWHQLSRSFTGDLYILKEWESSEEAILTQFLPLLRTENPFDFIFVGKNLLFDFMFISYRAKKYDLNGLDIRHFYNRVVLDIKPILVMINKSSFKGYDRVLDKTGALAKVTVPQLYKEGKYAELINYIRDEARVFIEAYQVLKMEMPLLRDKFGS